MHSPDPLEDTLAEALELLETAGRAALERFLAERPAAAPRLRQALAELRVLDALAEAAPAPPQWFGEFRLRGELGAGGMGIVYLAEQQSLHREVALKVVRPELLFFDGARERFRREIETVASLEHPAIVPILATGQVDGVPYYVMPRLRGRSADAVLLALAGRSPDRLRGLDLQEVLGGRDAATSSALGANVFAGSYWRAAVQLARQAALGIAHAHARGVLHRDLKPSNLMLLPDGRAVVLDFGLAQARGNAQMTQAGHQPGSPAYMAPEQLRGEPADERTDVYGLAATLHSLLGLRAPFATENAELLRSQIVAGQRRDLRHHRGLPAELLLVLDTALDVDRTRRYAGPQAFADDLQAVLDGLPIHARRLPWRVRAQRFAQRNRALSIAVACCLLFALVLPLALWWQAQRANQQLQLQVERADRGFAVSLDAVERLLASVARGRLRHVPAAQEVAAAQLRDACALFERLAGDASVADRVRRLHYDAWLHLASVEAARGDLEAATTAARSAAAIYVGYPEDPLAQIRRAVAENRLVGHLLDAGNDGAARELAPSIQAALATFAAGDFAAELARKHLPDAEYHLAVLAERSKDGPGYDRHLRAAVAAAKVVGDELGLAGLQLQLARWERMCKKLPECRELIAAAERFLTDTTLPERGWPIPRVVRAEASFQLGMLEETAENFGAAESAYRAALARFSDVLRDYPEEPTVRSQRGACQHQLANLRVRVKDFVDARALAEAAVADQSAVLQRVPGNQNARLALGEHRRTLCHALRMLDDLPALEVAARELGAMEGPAVWPLAAARSLLRCAEVQSERAVALRAEALQLLARSRAAGMRLRGEDALYAPLRGDPAFEALLEPAGGR